MVAISFLRYYLLWIMIKYFYQFVNKGPCAKMVQNETEVRVGSFYLIYWILWTPSEKA